MRALNLAVLMTLAALGGCATTPMPSVAQAPPNAFGGLADPDTASINLAAWAFSVPSHLRGQTAAAARAVAALDYAAGKFATSARWLDVPPLDRDELLEARTAMRQALGIAPDAPSQAVVNGLLAAFNALLQGNEAAARAALAPPVFPPDMLERLANVPFLASVNVATMRVANDVSIGTPGSGGLRFR